MREERLVSGWTLDDLRAVAAEVLAAERAEHVVDPAVFDISRMPASLKQYWLHGAGAAAIGWGTPGDFDRCVTAINAEITKHGRAPLPDHEIKGLCANLHKEATGATPGNAPGERHHAIEDPTARMGELIAALSDEMTTEFGWKVRQAGKFWHKDGTPAMPGEEGAGLLMHNPLTRAKKTPGTPARGKSIPTFDEFQKSLKDEQAKKDAGNGIKGAGLYDTTGRPKEVGSLDWKRGSYGSTSGDPRSTTGQYRISRRSDGSGYQLHHETLSGYGDDAKRTRKLVGEFGSEEDAKEAAEQHHSGVLTAAVAGVGQDPTARMAELIAEFAQRRVKDAEYWGRPVGTPITPGMRPAGHKSAGPPHRGGTHGNNWPKGSPSKPPGWGDPNPEQFADHIRAKYKLPAAKEDNAIRSDLPASQLPAVKAAAAAKVAAAAKAEPAITKAVTGAVAAHGGEMDRFDKRGPQFDARIKGAGSMERKVADGVMDDGLSPEEAAAAIRDSVRYTAVVPTDGYWAAGTRIGDDLEAAGYKRVKRTSGWRLDQNYAGRNDTFVGPDGVEFEVQFHTPESLHTAERNHVLYNISRQAGVPKSAKDELNAEQKAYIEANVPIPNDLPHT